SAWLEPMRTCRLYAYRFPAAPFRPHEVGGYWVAGETVVALERVEVGDLLVRHAEAGIELRVTPPIWPFWRRAVGSTVESRGSRLRNAAPHPEQLACPAGDPPLRPSPAPHRFARPARARFGGQQAP